MKLEQVLPMLRDGQIITRSKKWNPNSTTVILVKIEDNKLKFKLVFTTGEIINWAYYTLKTEDIFSENWELAG